MVKPAYSVSFLLSLNIFVWQNVLYFPNDLHFITIGGILVPFICITRLASNKIFSPSNKIHWQVGWAKDLSAPW
jgi:hypothetical protein